jgi:K+-transporting ATPase ATPase C chain
VADYRKANNLPDSQLVPADAVTASGSGLDPHISIKNALLQLPRVAKARGMSEDDLKKLVDQYTDGRDFGILGEPGRQHRQTQFGFGRKLTVPQRSRLSWAVR